MATVEVSSAVSSILDGFTNGMDVFMRMGPKRFKQNPKIIRMTKDEFKVHESLTRRPKEIRAEYTQNVSKHGRRFEEGDSLAYSSLAHTLFILNTGLINLINHILSSEIVDKSESRRNLLELSETAAISTMKALGQLNARLSIAPQFDLVPSPKQEDTPSTKQSSSLEASTRPPPTPLLGRGGWVRTKSGSSVVTSSDARKRETQRDKHQRSKSSPASPTLTVSSTASTSSGSSGKHSRDLPESHVCSCQKSSYVSSAESAWYESHNVMLSSSLGRAPSMLLVPADYFREQNIMRPESPPPRPSKVPLHLRPNPSSRPRPPSTATFLTASTKLGEIPEHKWPDRALSEEEQERLPLPYVIPPPLEAPKKRSKGLKFWKRPERKAIANGYRDN